MTVKEQETKITSEESPETAGPSLAPLLERIRHANEILAHLQQIAAASKAKRAEGD